MTERRITHPAALWLLTLALAAAGCRSESASNGAVNSGDAATGATPTGAVPTTSTIPPGGHEAANHAAQPSPSAQSPAPDAGAANDAERANQSRPREPAADAAAARGERPKPAPNEWLVISVSGAWVLDGNGSRPLGMSDVVREGSVLRPQGQPASGAHVTLASGPLSVRQACADPQACERGWRVPKAAPRAAAANSVMKRVLELLNLDGGQRYPPYDAASRGSPLREAVLRLDPGGVDISPAVRRLARGRHALSIWPAAGGAARSLDLDWDERRPTAARLAGLEPGLYKVGVIDEADRAGPKDDAWVLVSAPANYPRDSRRFAELTATTGRWGEAVDGSLKRNVLRAGLELMAQGKME